MLKNFVSLFPDRFCNVFSLRCAGFVLFFVITVSPVMSLAQEPSTPNTGEGVDMQTAYQPPPSAENMVRIPAGRFVMGGFSSPIPDSSIAIDFDSTLVDSLCYLPEYLIDRTPVTNEDFADFLNSGHPEFYHPAMGIRKIPEEDRFEAYPQYANHPVTYVYWYAAAKYADWTGKRLPSEAEWEKAARGTRSTLGSFHGVGVGFPYPWGNESPSAALANYLGTSPSDMPGTSPVAFYDGSTHDGLQTRNAESPYGLQDMSGNVWEWTRTGVIASSIEGGAAFTDTLFVIRGGSWRDPPENIRVDIRPAQVPEARARDIGFRCVKDIHSPVDVSPGGETGP